MVRATVGLLRERGLHGTGLMDVLERSQAPRGSLYFHFPGGKTQLASEALSVTSSAIGDWLRRHLAESADVAIAVNGWLDRYVVELERTGFSRGCPVAGVALDIGPEDEELRQVCGSALASWSSLLAEALRREGRPATEAGHVAESIVALLEGALMMARIQRSSAPIRSAQATLGMMLARPALS
jgi:TetR/AcrR family transcriptional repressor of lmrAB and yxaGH operons